MKAGRVVAIVQARFASQRLPGKVMADIAGKPMLLRVVERVRRAKTLDQVGVATTQRPDDDPVEALCRGAGIACFRGSAQDVLDRTFQAARAWRADTVVRITGDCPLIDAELIDELVHAFLSADPPVEFAANRLPLDRTLPIGLDAEVCSISALETAWREAGAPHQREHVMPFLYENPQRFRILHQRHVPSLGHLRWTVDTAEDLEFVRRVFAHFQGRDDFGWEAVRDLVHARPDLADVNAAVPHRTHLDVEPEPGESSVVEREVPEMALFTSPKAFEGHVGVIQRNALRSWMQLRPQAEILVIGDEPGVSAVASELGLSHLPDVERSGEGTPLVSSVFSLARGASRAPLLAYLNADIVLLDDFVPQIRTVRSRFTRFLLVGQRWDLEVSRPLDFGPGWADRLRDEIRRKGRLHPPSGSDYFVFPRDEFPQIPAFAVGRAGWDNWMVFEGRRRGIPVVDATPALTVIHQSHDYGHLPGGRAHYRLPESQANLAMAGGRETVFRLADADWKLDSGEPVRKSWRERGYQRQWEADLIARFGPGWPARITRMLFHPRETARYFLGRRRPAEPRSSDVDPDPAPSPAPRGRPG